MMIHNKEMNEEVRSPVYVVVNGVGVYSTKERAK
jgi:hypothetical protein